MRMISAVACAALLSACTPTTTKTKPPTSTSADAATTPRPAQVVDYVDFNSDHVQPRNISVWLPAGYAPDSGQTYPVIYAHDGQNLFDPSTSYAGVEWGLDEAADRLIAVGKAPPAIIVGIWNTNARWQEYAPPASGAPTAEHATRKTPNRAPMILFFIATTLSQIFAIMCA